MTTQKKVNEIVIDGKDAVAGRLASFTAKKLLQGHKVIIINSEKVILIGNKKKILEDYLEKRRLGKGVQKGPYYYSKPEMILRRTIRGMLPWKRSRGKEAFKNIYCVVGEPAEYKGKAIKFEVKEPLNFISLGELTKLIKQK